VIPDEQQPHSRWRSIALIGVIFAVVLLALYIGTQVISVLFGIIMPPVPPVPSAVTEISHESTDYGIDVWTYTTPSEACDVVVFYETNGGVCMVAPGQCERAGTDQITPTAFAECSGETPFSIFNMRWSAVLYQTSAQESQIDLSREVFWIGTGPTTTPRFDIGQLSPSPNATTE
jgi:hypothetical protein